MKYLVDHLHRTGLFHRGGLTEEEAINLDSYYRLHPLPRSSRRHLVDIPASGPCSDVCEAACDLPVGACDRETFERRFLASVLYRSTGVREDFVVIPLARLAHPSRREPPTPSGGKGTPRAAAPNRRCSSPRKGSVVTLGPSGNRGLRRICLNCLVRAQCREYALSAGELYGTWVA